LIVLNIGLDIGVLNTEVFTIFVIMAVITTVMTTPIVYLIYQRVEKKKEEKELEEGKKTESHSALLYIHDTSTAEWMAKVASLLNDAAANITLRLLMVKEVSDRPSSYFFADIYHKPAAKKRHRKGLAGIKSRAEKSGMELETKILVSADPPADVSSYVEERDFCMVMFELRKDVEHHTETNFLNRSIHTIEEVFDWSTASAKIVHSALDHIHSAIAVLIDKGSNVPEKVQKILFVYTGKPHENYALTTMLSLLEQGVTLFIVTTDANFAEEHKIDTENTNVQISIASSEDSIHITKAEYDLVVQGAQRDAKDIYGSRLVHNCPISVLLLYPALDKHHKKGHNHHHHT
jgi:hypothetical protein